MKGNLGFAMWYIKKCTSEDRHGCSSYARKELHLPSAGEFLLTFWISGCNAEIGTCLREHNSCVFIPKQDFQACKSKQTPKYVRTLNWVAHARREKCSLYHCSLHKPTLAAYSTEILGNYSVTCWDSIWSHLLWKTGQNLLFITQHNCRAGCIAGVGEIAEIPVLRRKHTSFAHPTLTTDRGSANVH